MDARHVRFVVAWTLAPSLEVASAVLGLEPATAVRQAKMLRAAGVPLKDLNDIQGGQDETIRDQTNEVQVLPPARRSHAEEVARAEADVPSFIAQLKTEFQLSFYERYTAARGGGPSFAEVVANHHAMKSGDIGRAGIASGIVEDAAFEAVAQLVVEPPKGFNSDHPKVHGFVIRHIQYAVRNRLNREYGWQGRRMCRRITQQSAAPVSPAESADDLARAQALEDVRARQLEQVRAVLPGGHIPTDRAGRIATLRAFGEGKTQAVTNAAEHRFFGVLAQYVRAALEFGAHRSPSDTSKDESLVEESIQAPDEHIEKPQLEMSVYEVPESIRQRLVPTATKSLEQRRAERFVVAWQTSSSAREAATRLGKPVKSVTAYARRLRRLGVTCLKTLPTSPGPLVRGARALIPSCN